MKKLLIGITAVMLSLVGVSAAFAMPNNNNPQVVANYPSGIHAIPTDPITYLTGSDLVTMRGDTGQIEQWYTDSSGHGIHSVWNISHHGTCPTNKVTIANAYPSWGDYLTPGATYCIMNNAF